MSDPNPPGTPRVPEVPDVPAVPEVPQVPDVPETPDTPDIPPAPQASAGGTDGGATAWQPGDSTPPPPGYASPNPAPAFGSADPAPGYGMPPAYGTPAATPPAYGAPTTPPPGYGAPAGQYGGGPATKTPVLSIISMVSGIVGLLGVPVAFIPFVGGVLGLFFPAAAIVLAVLGKNKEPGAKAFWVTGLITGIVGAVLAIGSIIVWAVLFATFDNSNLQNFNY
jgi:hypothetical protein